MDSIKILFLDIGGVLLTNGWDHELRKKMATIFHIDFDEINPRHQLIFDTYERGSISFDEYLSRTIFYKKRDFTFEEVKSFIFNAARPYDKMISLIRQLKQQYHLKIGAVSNEGRELAADRVSRFDLGSWIDFFIISSYVHFKKPDPEIYQLAIDVAQVPAEHIVYIDDRLLLVEIAIGLGLKGIHHVDVDSTHKELLTYLNSKDEK